MKRIKELAVFLTGLLVLPVLLFVIAVVCADLLADRVVFVGVENYIRLFLQDEIFGKALFNTVMFPAIFGVLVVAAFAVVVGIIRKKHPIPRWGFYIGSALLGAVTALLYGVFTYGAPVDSDAAQTIVSHIVGYSPSVGNILTVPHFLLYAYVGTFTAFIFWVFEQMAGAVKRLKQKGEA